MQSVPGQGTGDRLITMSGAAHTSVRAGAAALAALAPLCIAAAPGQPADVSITNEIAFYLRSDGTVQAREEIVFLDGVPDTFERIFVTREHYDDAYDRVFEVERLSVEDGAAQPVDAELRDSDDGLTIKFDCCA
jgi:hypothetical protein